MSSTDNPDDFDLPSLKEQEDSIGAAADSADWDERHAGLPRVLRYAMLVTDNFNHIEQRLISEIEELCPNFPLTSAWAATFEVETALALADGLDRCAVIDNKPQLRSLADSVRLVSLPASIGSAFFQHHRRVAKALLLAQKVIARHSDEQVRCKVEQFVYGWAVLPACDHLTVPYQSAAANAIVMGLRMAEHRVAAAERDHLEEQLAQTSTKKISDFQDQETLPEKMVRDHHVVVATLSNEAMSNVRLKQIVEPLKNVINVDLPLTEVPPLHQVRNKLLSEFPYAADVIDFALADLVGRTTVRLHPLLLYGDSGGGKTLFCRRLGEVLGLSVWREDSARADSAAFGGTDRRWHSAEPCHALLAVARGRSANPLILLDELDKPPTRSDHGRLWDVLLSILETETNSRHPDPALQTNLDLSHVCFVATANRLDPLPSQILDRFRVIKFPKPRSIDLDMLLPALLADIARGRGLNQNWVPPLDRSERTAVARSWRGGSVRRLRRIVEVVLRERDLRATRN